MTVHVQLALKRDLVASKGQQGNLSYQSIELAAGIRIEEAGQPNILASLPVKYFGHPQYPENFLRSP